MCRISEFGLPGQCSNLELYTKWVQMINRCEFGRYWSYERNSKTVGTPMNRAFEQFSKYVRTTNIVSISNSPSYILHFSMYVFWCSERDGVSKSCTQLQGPWAMYDSLLESCFKSRLVYRISEICIPPSRRMGVSLFRVFFCYRNFQICHLLSRVRPATTKRSGSFALDVFLVAEFKKNASQYATATLA